MKIIKKKLWKKDVHNFDYQNQLNTNQIMLTIIFSLVNQLGYVNLLN